jgi:hypothetical protein
MAERDREEKRQQIYRGTYFMSSPCTYLEAPSLREDA